MLGLAFDTTQLTGLLKEVITRNMTRHDAETPSFKYACIMVKPMERHTRTRTNKYHWTWIQ